jgi:hypothetical protein
MTGLRIPAGDPAELAAALVRLLSLPERARRLIGGRGRAWVTGHFDARMAAEPLLGLYGDIVGRTPDPR